MSQKDENKHKEEDVSRKRDNGLPYNRNWKRRKRREEKAEETEEEEEKKEEEEKGEGEGEEGEKKRSACPHFSHSLPTRLCTYQVRPVYIDSYVENVITMSVEEYMRINKTVGRHLITEHCF